LPVTMETMSTTLGDLLPYLAAIPDLPSFYVSF